MPAFIRLACAVAVLAAFGSAAPARTLYPSGRDDWLIAPEGVQPGLRTADGRACVKQCPEDRLPCDPPAYKTADGRCTTQWR